MDWITSFTKSVTDCVDAFSGDFFEGNAINRGDCDDAGNAGQ